MTLITVNKTNHKYHHHHREGIRIRPEQQPTWPGTVPLLLLALPVSLPFCQVDCYHPQDTVVILAMPVAVVATTTHLLLHPRTRILSTAIPTDKEPIREILLGDPLRQTPVVIDGAIQ